MEILTRDPIVLRNIKMLDERSVVGIRKYNKYLDREDIDLLGFLQHALEETLDHANYLQAAINKINEVGKDSSNY